MKKTLLFLCVVLGLFFGGAGLLQMARLAAQTTFRPVYGGQEAGAPRGSAGTPALSYPGEEAGEGKYELYVESELYRRFETYEEALALGEGLVKAAIRQRGKSSWLWENYPPYNVFPDRDTYEEFETFTEAAAYAAAQPKAYIYYRKDNALVWSNAETLPKAVRLKAPWIGQYPELPRGCEVTSLAMLLNARGVAADKMRLAEEIAKADAPYQTATGVIYAGSPYRGFVGDMWNIQKPGLGVYHVPIHELLSSYLPDSALDLTGTEFEHILYFLAHDTPVWVIINSRFQELPASAFETWHTDDGELKITYSEHSVLVTGYDEQYIYFNDPFSRESVRAPRKPFIAAWEQMGRQAVTVSP